MTVPALDFHCVLPLLNGVNLGWYCLLVFFGFGFHLVLICHILFRLKVVNVCIRSGCILRILFHQSQCVSLCEPNCVCLCVCKFFYERRKTIAGSDLISVHLISELSPHLLS